MLGNSNNCYYNVITRGSACYARCKKLSYAYMPIPNGLINAALEFFKLYRNA